MKICVAAGIACGVLIATSGRAEPAPTDQAPANPEVSDREKSISEALPGRGSAEAIARGKAAIARARDVYTNLKTYRDRSIVRKYQNYTDRDYSTITESEFVCERPGKFRVGFSKTPNFGPMMMVSDGGRYRRAVVESEVFTDDEAPDLSAPIVFKSDIVAENVPAHFYLVARSLPAPEMLLRTPREVIDSREETLDGRKGLRVVCLAVSEQEWEKPGAKADIVHEFWFDEKTGAIGEMVRDATVRTREGDKERQPDKPTGEPPHIATRIATITRISDVQIDQPMTPGVFALETQPKWKKVPEFMTNSGPDMGQYKLLGLAAPQFTLKNLQGKDVSLSELAGRVVVLDFWATWCGPCVSAMPHLQKLQEQFKDQPVTILGLNSDYALSDEKLAAWMEKRKFTFGTLRLAEGTTTFQDYGVGGIPHTVLIDKNGIVQDVTVGFMGDEHGEVLSARISKLLAGESLKTAEEFKSQRASGQKRAEPNVVYVRSMGEMLPVEEINANQLIATSQPASNTMAYTAGDIQLEDGTVGVVTPTYKQNRAGFLIYRPGQAVASFEVEGVIGMPMAWTSLRDGGLKIAGVFNNWEQQSMAQRISALTCWDLEGKKLWSFDLGLPDQCSGEIKLASADLDRSGRPEVVAAVCVEEMLGSGQRRRGGKNLSKICVLDADGKLLATKALPLYTNISLSVVPRTGQDPAIIVIGGGKIWELTYSPDSGKISGAEPAK